jgi:hypothetical protein
MGATVAIISSKEKVFFCASDTNDRSKLFRNFG